MSSDGRAAADGDGVDATTVVAETDVRVVVLQRLHRRESDATGEPGEQTALLAKDGDLDDLLHAIRSSSRAAWR
jgi:hypothetical protein